MYKQKKPYNYKQHFKKRESIKSHQRNDDRTDTNEKKKSMASRLFSTDNRKRGIKTFGRTAMKRRFVAEERDYERIAMMGIIVSLPLGLRPYPTQKLMMVKMLTALRDKTNALIESPTGSGKTLALLASSCAWLARYKEQREESFANCLRHAAKSNDANVSMASSVDTTMTFPNASMTSLIDSTTFLSNDTQFDCSNEHEEDFDNAESRQDYECTCLPRIRIYYGTRTHKQIAQIVKEYARLPYGLNEQIRHTILASREHSCINPSVRSATRNGAGDITVHCRELLSSDGPGCTFRNEHRKFENNAPRLRTFIEESGGERVWDMEELVTALSESSPAMCPYFAASRTLTMDADLIFCPFNYILDPIIRTSSDVHLRNSIIILDEAHNVEDTCREASSFNFQERELIFCMENLMEKEKFISNAIQNQNLISNKMEDIDEDELNIFDYCDTDMNDEKSAFSEKTQKLIDYYKALIHTLYQWLKTWAKEALKGTYSAFNDCYTMTASWEQLRKSLENGQLYFIESTSMHKQLKTAWSTIAGSLGASGIGAAEPLTNASSSTEDPTTPFRPSQLVIFCVEKFLYFMHYFSLEHNQNFYRCNVTIGRDQTNPNAFVEPTQRDSRHGASHSLQHLVSMPFEVTTSINSAKFIQIYSTQKASKSPFEPILPNHDTTINLWCMLPSTAFTDAFSECRSVILASGTLWPTETLKTELGTEFSSEMEGAQVINKDRIFATAISQGPLGRRLNATFRNMVRGSPFFEELAGVVVRTCETVPRGVLCFISSYRVLDMLVEAIHSDSQLTNVLRSRKVIFEEPRRSSDLQATLDRYADVVRFPQKYGQKIDGALMLAVFRGKVSEGIDFADDMARCVICVGIPYPNARNELVVQKRRFNDANSRVANVLSGDEWYTTQAYRALNQALGRCLRHREDWGALVLVDERYEVQAKMSNKTTDAKKISRWVRDRMRVYAGFDAYRDALGAFVARMTQQGHEENMNDIRGSTSNVKVETSIAVPLIPVE